MTLSEDAKQRILKMCREQLSRRKPPDTEALYGRAVRIDPGVREMSLRQFHATFPLQVRRERARSNERQEPSEGTGSTKDPDGQFREAVRQVLLDFAIGFSDAEGVAGMVNAWEQLDDHVARIFRAYDEQG